MKASAEVVEEAMGAFSFSSEFVLFILNSRMHYHLNLDLAFYLSHAQSIHLRGAARLFDTRREILLDQVLNNNPAFERRTINALQSREGGHRRDILLSAKARGLIEEIQALALLRRGGDRCQELKAEAERARKERTNEGRGYEEWIMEKCALVHGNPNIRIEAIAENAPRYGRTISEALEVLRNARG